VQRATQWLRIIWDRPDVGIKWDGEGNAPLVFDGTMDRTLSECTDPEQQQVVACMQMALISVLARRRIHLPILLQDSIFAGPALVARRLAALLCEIATSGQQILLLTADASVASWFQDLGMPTLIVSRAPIPRITESREPVEAVVS